MTATPRRTGSNLREKMSMLKYFWD